MIKTSGYQHGMDLTLSGMLELKANPPPNTIWSNLHIRTVWEGRHIIISVPGSSQPVRLTIADGRGRIAGRLSTGPDGTAKWDSFGFPMGVYYIRALGQYHIAFQRFRL